MKIVLSLSILYFLFNIATVKAQCIANAGIDTHYCASNNPIDTLFFGGNPTVHNGTAPYTYIWETSVNDGVNTWTASHFLNDTTIANPYLVNPFEESLSFYLTVIDSESGFCRDTINIQFSNFVVTLDQKKATIDEGDSVQLYTSVSGGIPPLTYQWSPTTHLSNPNSPTPWASPNQNTNYLLTITDSAGCVYGQQDLFEVFVNPLNIQEFENFEEPIFFPNPITENTIIQIPNSQNKDFQLIFFDLLGKKRKELSLNSSKTKMNVTDLTTGIYFYKLIQNEKTLNKGKIMVL